MTNEYFRYFLLRLKLFFNFHLTWNTFFVQKINNFGAAVTKNFETSTLFKLILKCWDLIFHSNTRRQFNTIFLSSGYSQAQQLVINFYWTAKIRQSSVSVKKYNSKYLSVWVWIKKKWNLYLEIVKKKHIVDIGSFMLTHLTVVIVDPPLDITEHID